MTWNKDQVALGCAADAPSVLKVAGAEPSRTSHPSGSRHWGCPLWGRFPAPGCSQPQKFLSALPCPSVADLFSEAARERWAVCVHRERVATGAVRIHNSMGSPRGERQPFAGFMPEAHQSKSSTPQPFGWDAAVANQIWWLSANSMASSPPQPEAYRFMRMPCSRRKGPDHAGCRSRPAPACAPPS